MTPAPDAPLLPASGEIHLWSLPADPAWRDEFRAAGRRLLSLAETDRLAGMKRPGPAARFLTGRILLRTVLARYLSQDPAAIGVALNAAGKPTLGAGAGHRPAFSLSHAGEETVLAVARDGDIGVDIESTDRAAAVDRISRRFFPEAECRYLDRCGSDRPEKALTLWTLKEAIVKARGDTVWEGLAGVSLTIDGPRLAWNNPPPGGDGWKLAAGPLGIRHILAVAHRRPAGRGHPPVFRHYDAAGTPRAESCFMPVYST